MCTYAYKAWRFYYPDRALELEIRYEYEANVDIGEVKQSDTVP